MRYAKCTIIIHFYERIIPKPFDIFISLSMIALQRQDTLLESRDLKTETKLLERSPFRFENISFEHLIGMLFHIPENATLRIGNVMMPSNEYVMKINGEWCLCIARETLSDCRIKEWSWDNSIIDIEKRIQCEFEATYPSGTSLSDFTEYKAFSNGWYVDFDFFYKYPISGVIKEKNETSDNGKPQILLTSEPMRFTSVHDVDRVYKRSQAHG